MTGHTGTAGRLTRRQGRILALTRQGLNAVDIAVRLHVPVATVIRDMTAIAARIDARRALQQVTR